MSGQVIRLVGMTSYDFSNVGVSSEGGAVVAQHVDVSQFRYATLLIRMHSGTIAQQMAVFKIKAFAEGYTSEDPTAVFGDATALLSEQIGAGDSAPFFIAADLSSNMGSMISVIISGQQDSNQGTLEGVFSMDLVLKN